MARTTSREPLPEGIFSILDTDLYKLTMQSAVLKYFPSVDVTYSFTNRTPDMKLSRAAFSWLQCQIERLENISLSHEELSYLRTACPYLSEAYLDFLQIFRFRPKNHILARFVPDTDFGSCQDKGYVEIYTHGHWVETILYEIPLLALTSEAYFKFCDKDWSHDGQVEQAREKASRLLEYGCTFSEFGSRRRRDYRTQEMVIEGLKQAQDTGASRGHSGKLTGTSNVHFAMRFGIAPIGTVAHEWFMGVAAVTNSYGNATEAALSYWVGTFGEGVLAIALTDTFGTSSFLKAFSRPIPANTTARPGSTATLSSAASGPGTQTTDSLSTTKPPVPSETNGESNMSPKSKTYADIFTGTRQDSGNPLEFVKLMRKFYDEQGTQGKKIIVFSDSLNVDRCIEYKKAAEEAGFVASFGVGTFFTNDFKRASTGEKSAPLNIVIKLSSADGRPAVKISDNMGKNTGDSATVAEVKQQLGYTEQAWGEGDERTRWGS